MKTRIRITDIHATDGWFLQKDTFIGKEMQVENLKAESSDIAYFYQSIEFSMNGVWYYFYAVKYEVIKPVWQYTKAGVVYRPNDNTACSDFYMQVLSSDKAEEEQEKLAARIAFLLNEYGE